MPSSACWCDKQHNILCSFNIPRDAIGGHSTSASECWKKYNKHATKEHDQPCTWVGRVGNVLFSKSYGSYELCPTLILSRGTSQVPHEQYLFITVTKSKLKLRLHIFLLYTLHLGYYHISSDAIGGHFASESKCWERINKHSSQRHKCQTKPSPSPNTNKTWNVSSTCNVFP